MIGITTILWDVGGVLLTNGWGTGCSLIKNSRREIAWALGE